MPASPRSGVLVVGESLVDITTAGDKISVHPGGSPLNLAVGLSRLGVPTTLATQLGHDAYGDLVRTHLAASAVALLELGPPGPTGTATASLDAQGAAAYEFDLRWDPASLALPAGFDLLHVGSLGATLAPGAELVGTLARDARRTGIGVSLDPNIRTALTPDLAAVRRSVLDLVAHADVVKLSDQDAAALYPGRSPDDVLDHLLGSGPGLVALTRGGEGALLATPAARVVVPAQPVPVVDTIGAGDSFMAALLSALRDRSHGAGALDREELTSVGTFACRAAATACSRPGADPPWRAEQATGSPAEGASDSSYTGR